MDGTRDTGYPGASSTSVQSNPSWYLAGLGAVAIAVTLILPRGLWGALVDRFELRLVPVGYTLRGLLHAVAGRSAGNDAQRLSVGRLAAPEDGDPPELYDELTASRTRTVRLEDVLKAMAPHMPDRLPSADALETERRRPLAEKHGVELGQGTVAAELLADARTGRHLVESMLAPLPESERALERFRRDGVADLGPVRVSTEGRAGILELRNPRHLNAEDGSTLGPMEVGVDLILLHPGIEVSVLRGGVIDRAPYAGQRVSGRGSI